MRKYRDTSVEEEQSLVSRVGVYCDLVLMGKKSWDDFHSELSLHVGGQKSEGDDCGRHGGFGLSSLVYK